MNLQQIKAAVDAGKIVHWENSSYVVKKNQLGEYYILCPANNYSIGLTWRDGVTMNGKENQFYLSDQNRS